MHDMKMTAASCQHPVNDQLLGSCSQASACTPSSSKAAIQTADHPSLIPPDPAHTGTSRFPSHALCLDARLTLATWVWSWTWARI